MIRRLFFFASILIALLSACSDNDSFSSDPSQRLTFSKDTVKLDTLFSAVPSSTYTFWVYNNSSDGIRIRTVRLDRGNQSGFRVNVDGTFVNPVVNDLEIRKNDSIRVFVEITSLENAQDVPQLVEDNLLFTLENGVVQKVNLRTWSWDAKKMTNLVVTADMTIEESKPLVLYGSGITIEEGATLTIKNTTLYFHAHAGITVKGRLVAEQSVFRGDRLDHMFNYLPYDRVDGQWQGITVVKGSTGCDMTDCEVRNPMTGFNCVHADLCLKNTIVHNCKGAGIFAQFSAIMLDGCQVSNTLNDCVTLLGSSATIDHTTLAQFYPLSANRGYAIRWAQAKEKVEETTETYGVSLTMSNTLMTGYKDDVLSGEKRTDDGMVTYEFTNCMLRTPAIDDAEFFKDIIWEKPTDEIQGTKHFKLIDETNMIYDFTLKEESPAYQKGIGRIVVTP